MWQMPTWRTVTPYYRRLLEVAVAERVSASENPGQKESLVTLLAQAWELAKKGDKEHGPLAFAAVGGNSKLLASYSRSGGFLTEQQVAYGYYPAAPGFRRP